MKSVKILLKLFGLIFFAGFLTISCTHKVKTSDAKPQLSAREMTRSPEFDSGWLVIVQGATSANETLINVMTPRLKNFEYLVKDSKGNEYKVEKYDSVHHNPVHYKVDKLHVTGLIPNNIYQLHVIDQFRSSVTRVDYREFQTLDLSAPKTTFATLSCASDDWRFNSVIDPIWNKLISAQPDFILMSGDTVYVDSFSFVERKKATELDIWWRYIETFQRIPLYRSKRLIPVLATWDDHDFGTNDGDRDFIAKNEAARVFKAFFGGRDIPRVYANGPGGVSQAFYGFGQSFYLMDNRTFRQPNKDQKTQEPYGHWGERQHKWLMKEISKDMMAPSWIVNGNQIHSGVDLSFKEAFEVNHPKHFSLFIDEIKKVEKPIGFISGDIHFSEIMEIPEERLGYKSFEITSSAIHSYAGSGWENPLRLSGAVATEFNYLLVTSEVVSPQHLRVEVRSQGLADKDYFHKKFEIKR